MPLADTNLIKTKLIGVSDGQKQKQLIDIAFEPEYLDYSTIRINPMTMEVKMDYAGTTYSLGYLKRKYHSMIVHHNVKLESVKITGLGENYELKNRNLGINLTLKLFDPYNM